jgi:hypothetical protein
VVVVVAVVVVMMVDWWRRGWRNLYCYLHVCPEEVDNRFLENVGNHV